MREETRETAEEKARAGAGARAGTGARVPAFENNRQMVWYFLRGSRRWFVLSACFAALVSLCDMLSPQLVTFTVDAMIGEEEPQLPAAGAWLVERAGGMAYLREHFWLMAAAAALLGVAAGLFRFLFRSCNVSGAETLTRRVRDELFSKLMKVPEAWYGQNKTGDLIQRCTSDVQTIKRFISEQFVQLVSIVILIVMAIAFMAGIHAGVTLLVAAFVPFTLVWSVIFHAKVGKEFRTADEEEGKLSAIAQENLTGVRVIRAFGRESFERERFETQNTHYTGVWVAINKLFAVYFSAGSLLMGLQVLAVMIPGAVLCIRGEITTGEYIALNSYNHMLGWPVRQLGRVITEMSKAGVSIGRLREVMNAPEETQPAEALRPPMDRDIAFEHVSFRYGPNAPEVLQDVSFTIPAGSTVGILGGTGSGKSTLMYLFEKFYDLPSECGTISVGGTDIRRIDTAYLRAQTGFVMQEPFLFSRTLSENIAITAETPDMERVRRVSKVACIDDAIESFTAGYDTVVGERGVTLSGGQKQRTAIARTLMEERKILIFDDSLSAVDAETDAKIRHALHEHTKDATVILIAHRITTLMNADRIIVLDRGRVAEQGTHEELLAAGGLYRRIYDLQAQGLEEGGEDDEGA